MASDLLHIRVGKELKQQMRKLKDIGLFSTDAEIAREGIRHLLMRYLNEAGLDQALHSKLPGQDEKMNGSAVQPPVRRKREQRK